MLSETLARYGVHVPPRRRLKPRDVQDVLAAVRGRHEEMLVNTLVLRSLRKARYDTANVGHFGLASEGYSHFTSPIRRYPDLLVHRILAASLLHRDSGAVPDPAHPLRVGDSVQAGVGRETGWHSGAQVGIDDGKIGQ